MLYILNDKLLLLLLCITHTVHHWVKQSNAYTNDYDDDDNKF